MSTNRKMPTTLLRRLQSIDLGGMSKSDLKDRLVLLERRKRQAVQQVADISKTELRRVAASYDHDIGRLRRRIEKLQTIEQMRHRGDNKVVTRKNADSYYVNIRVGNVEEFHEVDKLRKARALHPTADQGEIFATNSSGRVRRIMEWKSPMFDESVRSPGWKFVDSRARRDFGVTRQSVPSALRRTLS